MNNSKKIKANRQLSKLKLVRRNYLLALYPLQTVIIGDDYDVLHKGQALRSDRGNNGDRTRQCILPLPVLRKESSGQSVAAYGRRTGRFTQPFCCLQ